MTKLETFTVVNGPSHGEIFEFEQDPRLSGGFYVNRISESITKTYPEDNDPQFESHYMVRKYLLKGPYAYYISETVFYPGGVLPAYPENPGMEIGNA